MDNFEKLVIGFLLFVITSVVAYLFRMRQLYAAAPKLYRHAPISGAGSLCELIVYNKGNQAEENIRVEFDPDLKIELLASGTSDLTMEGATLKIERLHKYCEASAMLLVEAGVLDASRILSVSSKATKGKVCKKATEIPPNYATTFVALVLAIGFVPALIYGFKLYEQLNAKYVEYRLETIYKVGWSNLANYYASDMRMSYSNQEFPIRLAGRQVDKNKEAKLKFDVYNKTALPMKVYVDLGGRPANGYSPYFASTKVEPMSRATLTTKEPERSAELPDPRLDFSIKVGGEYAHTLIYRPTGN